MGQAEKSGCSPPLLLRHRAAMQAGSLPAARDRPSRQAWPADAELLRRGHLHEGNGTEPAEPSQLSELQQALRPQALLFPPPPPMLCSFFHLFCNYCFFGDGALEQRPGCPARSPHATMGRTGSAGCPGAATLPSAPSPGRPSSRSGQPQPRSAAAVPMGRPQDPRFPEAPTAPPGSLRRCRWGWSSAAGPGHARSSSDGGGRPGTGRNSVPAPAASFAGAALPTSAKPPRHAEAAVGLPRAPSCRAAALREAAGGPRAGGSALSPGRAQGWRCFSGRRTHTTTPPPPPPGHRPWPLTRRGSPSPARHRHHRRAAAVAAPSPPKPRSPGCRTPRPPRLSRAGPYSHARPRGSGRSRARVERSAGPAPARSRTPVPARSRTQGTRALSCRHPHPPTRGTRAHPRSHAGHGHPHPPTPPGAPTRAPAQGTGTHGHPHPPTRGLRRGRTCAGGGSSSSGSSSGSGSRRPPGSPRSSPRRSGAAGPPMSRTCRGRGAQGRAGPGLSPRRESAGPGRIQDAASCSPPPNPGPGPGRDPPPHPAAPGTAAAGGGRPQPRTARCPPPPPVSRSLCVSPRTRHLVL